MPGTVSLPRPSPFPPASASAIFRIYRESIRLSTLRPEGVLFYFHIKERPTKHNQPHTLLYSDAHIALAVINVKP